MFFLSFLCMYAAQLPSDLDAHHRAENYVNQMTAEEKIDYIGGHNYFYIRSIPRLKIPELKMADGPIGV